jgi:hypothetical protein
VWEGLDGCPIEHSDSLPNGTEASQQDIRTIPVGFQAESAVQFVQPKDCFGGPTSHDVEDGQGNHRDQGENTAHAFHGLDAQVLDIQALPLIKAETMFNLSA